MSPPSRRGRDSDPGGVDGADATGLRDRVARGLLAAPRDAEARPKVKVRRPLGRAASDAAQKTGVVVGGFAAHPPEKPRRSVQPFKPCPERWAVCTSSGVAPQRGGERR